MGGRRLDPPRRGLQDRDLHSRSAEKETLQILWGIPYRLASPGSATGFRLIRARQVKAVCTAQLKGHLTGQRRAGLTLALFHVSSLDCGVGLCGFQSAVLGALPQAHAGCRGTGCRGSRLHHAQPCQAHEGTQLKLGHHASGL